MKKNITKRGFMMVEVIIAASIIVVSVLALMTIAEKSVSIGGRLLHTTQSAFLLEEGAESVRILRDNAWSNISSLALGTTYYPTFSGGTWTLATTPNTVGIFTRTVVIGSVNRDNTTKDIVTSGGTLDPDIKLVTVTVSWSERGTVLTKTLSFYILNIF